MGSEFEPFNHVKECNEEKVCGFYEVSHQNWENMDLDDVEIMPNVFLHSQGSEVEEEEYVNQSPLTVISLEDNCSLEDLTATTSDFECMKSTHIADDPLTCNGPVSVPFNHDPESRESGLFTNEGEMCGFNEASHQNLENMDLDDVEFMPNALVPSQVSEVDQEECVRQSPLIVSSLEYGSSLEDLTLVMVYRLNNDGKWDVQGAGHVTIGYLDVRHNSRSEDLGLFVIDEEDNETLLVHRFTSDGIHRKQEGTSNFGNTHQF